jgi:GTPase SAR1 family protein
MFSDSSLYLNKPAQDVEDIKILVVGDSGVGKTTLIHYACFGKFENL